MEKLSIAHGGRKKREQHERAAKNTTAVLQTEAAYDTGQRQQRCENLESVNKGTGRENVKKKAAE